MFEACPICNARLESIPILNNEQFKISHTLKAGFSLEFRMKKKEKEENQYPRFGNTRSNHNKNLRRQFEPRKITGGR
jgi:hypothetical protein